jgi:hypothetical protein
MQNTFAQAALLDGLLDGVVATPDDGFGVRADDGLAARHLDEVAGARGLGGLEDVDLLHVGLGVVPRHDEHALDALQRLFHAGTIAEIGDGNPGVRAEHLTRLVRVAHDAQRILAERFQLLDRRPPRVPRRAEYRNHRVLLQSIRLPIIPRSPQRRCGCQRLPRVRAKKSTMTR